MTSLQSKPSPALPWEVIEAIIDECSGQNTTLYAFALTCSQLFPRSRLSLLADANLNSGDQSSKFHNAIQEYPHLRPFVRSLSISLSRTGGNGLLPLLALLPHLRHLKLRQCDKGIMQPFRPPSPPRATHIQSLTIVSFQFDELAHLHVLISIFPNLEHLTCEGLTLSDHHSSVPRGAQARANLRTLNILNDTDFHCAHYLITQLLHPSGEAAQKHDFQTSITWWWPLFVWNRRCRGAVKLVGKLDHGLYNITIVLWSSSFPKLYHDGIRRHDPVTPMNELLACTSGHIYTTIEGSLRSRKTISWVDEVNKFIPSHATEICRWKNVEYTSDPGHDDRVTSLAISPDGRWVATASQDHTIILWDANAACISQEWIVVDGPVYGLAFSPDSRYLASTGDRKLAIWDITGTAHEIASDVLKKPLRGCAWSEDGAFIASSSESDLPIWDAHTFKRLKVLDQGPCGAVQFSTDSRILMAFGGLGGSSVWNIQSGRLLLQIGISMLFILSPCGTCAASHNGTFVTVFRISGGQSIQISLQSPHSYFYVAFSPDGLLLMTPFESRDLRIWDARTGALVQSLCGHEDWLRQACFSPCGNYVASACKKTIKLWRVRDGSCLATLPYAACGGKTKLAFTPDGTMLWLASCWDGVVQGRRVQDFIPDSSFVHTPQMTDSPQISSR